MICEDGRSTLSAPNASIHRMFVPVFALTDHTLAEDFHKVGCMALGLFTSKCHANLAGAEHEHDIVHGAKVLEATVVSAVLLRWWTKKTSLERLASLVSFCFIIPNENRRCRVTRAAVTASVAAPLNCKSTLCTYCRVFCVLCDFRQGDVCSWTVLTCGHTVYLQRTTRELFDRRFLAR